MPFKRNLIVLLLVIFIVAALPVAAQDGGLNDDELALIELVSTAQDNLLALDSYNYSGQQITQQTILSGEGTLALTLTQNITQDLSGSVVSAADNVNSTQSIAQTIETRVNTRDPERLNMSLDIVILDGAMYLRVPTAPSELRSAFPADWVPADEAAAYEGMAFVDLEQLANLMSNTLPVYELNDETVVAVEELESETINGVEMRLISISIAPNVALGGFGDQFGAFGAFDTDLFNQLLENTIATITMYIGAEDTQVYRIKSDVLIDFETDDFEGSALSLDQTTSMTINITEFNPEVEITVPEPAPVEEDTVDETEGEATEDTDTETEAETEAEAPADAG